MTNNIKDKSLRKQHVKDINIKVNKDKELENNMTKNGDGMVSFIAFFCVRIIL